MGELFLFLLQFFEFALAEVGFVKTAELGLMVVFFLLQLRESPGYGIEFLPGGLPGVPGLPACCQALPVAGMVVQQGQAERGVCDPEGLVLGMDVDQPSCQVLQHWQGYRLVVDETAGTSAAVDNAPDQ